MNENEVKKFSQISLNKWVKKSGGKKMTIICETEFMGGSRTWLTSGP